MRIASLLALLPALVGASATAQEKDTLPVVVLIGDSIRIGYTPYVTEQLQGKAEVVSPRENGGDSSNVLKNLDAWVIDRQPDVIHINAGLHDLKLDRKTRTHQVELDAYKENLRTILKRLTEETDARILFATTTPVLDERHNTVKPFDRLEADVEAYNGVARGPGRLPRGGH